MRNQVVRALFACVCTGLFVAGAAFGQGNPNPLKREALRSVPNLSATTGSANLGGVCGDPAAGDCCEANGTPGCDDAACCELVCGMDPFCCDVAWDGICAGEAENFCGDLCAGGGNPACTPDAGDCCSANGTPGCDNADCCNIVCGADPFCCDVEWDGICAGSAQSLCGDLCLSEPCTLECPPGALEEGEPCGDDTNGGCNNPDLLFTDAVCGDTFCGTAWADGGTRDTDWYLVTHAGGVISSTVVANFPAVNFIVDVGGGDCSVIAVVGEIGCADECANIAPASADLPAGTYAVFVAHGNCDGSGIFEGFPCGGNFNDYYVEINCVGAAVGACCLPDDTCVDGVTQEECEAPAGGDCGDCDMPDPDGAPGCSDPECEAIVCGMDPFCCDVAWDSICAGEAAEFCDCGGGGGGLGGVYQGDGTTCDDVVCGVPTGACCQCDGAIQFCEILTEEECLALPPEFNAVYLGDDTECEIGGSTETTLESSPNLSIPDGTSVYVSDTINMGMDFVIDDIKIDLVINHTWVGDLCVTLQHDAGPTYEIIKRMGDAALACDGGCCGCGANDLNVTLWDSAAAGIEDQCSDGLTGEYYSESFNLSNFIGDTSAGAWTLSVNDNAGADTGTLASWAITFVQAGEPQSACAEADPDQCVSELQGFLDIKPTSCPNSFNLKSQGVLPVALVGTDEIPAGMVDVSSLLLSRADGMGGSVAPLDGPPGPAIEIDDVASPFEGELCDCHEFGGDGIDDVVMKFKTQDVVNELGLGGMPGNALVELTLTGALLDGTPFVANDCIRIVPNGGIMPAQAADLEGGAPGWGLPGN